mgnify:CR=1 FL=1
MKRFTFRSLLTAVSLFGTGVLGGCVSVHVSGSEPRVSYGMGIVNVQLQPVGDEPLMIATDGIGLVVSAHSLTLGAVKERVAVFPRPSACHTMFVVQGGAQFEALMNLLREEPRRLSGLCVVNEERS